MIDCPSCQQSVEITEKNYGTLFTCSHCRAVYFISWDGQPEMAEAEDAIESEEAAAPSMDPMPAEGSDPIDYSAEADYSEADPDYSDQANYSENYSDPANYAEPADPVSYSEPVDPVNDSESIEEETSDFASVFQPENHSGIEVGAEAELAPEPATPDTSDFADVTDFANGHTEAGPLVYMVIIEGIESSLLLSQLKDAMTDSRFGWDVSPLVEQARSGRLVLRAMSPTKASVLINRIKYMPLKISWRQDVFSGS